jgi:hypothetical protein
MPSIARQLFEDSPVLHVRDVTRNLVVMKRMRDALQKELASRNEDLSQLADQLIAGRQALQRSLGALRPRRSGGGQSLKTRPSESP